MRQWVSVKLLEFTENTLVGMCKREEESESERGVNLLNKHIELLNIIWVKLGNDITFFR